MSAHAMMKIWLRLHSITMLENCYTGRDGRMQEKGTYRVVKVASGHPYPILPWRQPPRFPCVYPRMASINTHLRNARNANRMDASGVVEGDMRKRVKSHQTP